MAAIPDLSQAIAHINLARGYRGGERQTDLLIRALGSSGVQQILIARGDSELALRMAGMQGLVIREVKGVVGAARALRGVGIAHAHEGRCVQSAALARTLYGVPYVITRRVVRPIKTNPFTRSMYRNAAALVGISSQVQEQLADYLPGVGTSVIADAFTPMEPNTEMVAMLRERYGSGLIVGHIGALVQSDKGQLTLIEVAKKFANVHFVFVGSGADEAMMRQAANSAKNIHFAGQVEDVASYLAAFDIFAYPSLREGLGSILLDAMRAGLPIVASETGGIPDIICHGHNGFLVPPGDVAALTDALHSIIRDPATQARFAAHNIEDAKAYSPAQMALAYQQIYSAILD